MKTALILLVCLLSCELGACIRSSGSTPMPARPTNTSAKIPANTLILGVN